MELFTNEAINARLERINLNVKAKGWSSGAWISLDAREKGSNISAYFSVGHPNAVWYHTDTHHKNIRYCDTLENALDFMEECVSELPQYSEEAASLMLESAKEFLGKCDRISDDWNEALQPLANLVAEKSPQVEAAE